MSKITVLISAGGTGGHILPALSTASALCSINDKVRVEFVSGAGRLEKQIYSQHDFKAHCLPVGRLRKNVSLGERCRTFFLLPFVLLKALQLILKIRPSLVVGMGGAVSGPVLLAGFLLGKKTVIFEPNVVPGLANRWLARFVKEVIVVFPLAQKFFKNSRRFAFPVRAGISAVSLKSKPDQPLRVLALGGSQGSAMINKAVGELIVSLEAVSAGEFSFVHQTGHQDFEKFKELYSGMENVKVFSFLQDIHNCYEWADVVVGRAGAGFIAELSCVGRAGVLVPLAVSADGHQLKNARDLEKKSAVIVMEEKDFNGSLLKRTLRGLAGQPERVTELSARIHNLRLGASADSIARYLCGKYL